MSTLLDDIERFLAAQEMAPSTFGDQALGDRHFVRQLRSGRRVWGETEDKVRAFMASYSSPPAPPSSGNPAAVSPCAESGREAAA